MLGDPIDAEAAARAILAGTATGMSKSGDDRVEMIRFFKLARDSAVKSQTQAVNQLKAVIVTAPPELREAPHGLTRLALLERYAAARPGELTTPLAASSMLCAYSRVVPSRYARKHRACAPN
jgi:hypothetical protein